MHNEREIIGDPHFGRGFILLDPTPGKRAPYGALPGLPPGGKAVWELAQWSSRAALRPDGAEHLPSGALRAANPAKAVTLGRPGTGDADLTLRVNASAEYGSRARKSGEPWVHLLAMQDIRNPPSLAELSGARLHVEVRLKASRRIATPDYTPDLHAAQFQIFFSIQNLNHDSRGYGQYLWFGVSLYDDRRRFAPAFQERDTGGTGMFITTPAGDTFTRRSAHEKKWITVDTDLLPLLREGLETAWRREFLRDSRSLADYRIAALNLGWEVPGILDVEMQVRKLCLKVTPKSAS